MQQFNDYYLVESVIGSKKMLQYKHK